MQKNSNDIQVMLAEDKTTCCGCGLCTALCPKDAIRMQEDKNGYRYPVINTELCIKCKRCLNHCAYKKENSGTVPLEVFASSAKDKQLLQQAASGGIFGALALRILNAGGTVFGSALEQENGKLIPRHVMINNQANLPKIQGSKYVQSITDDVFALVQKEVQTGKPVLFSGTPCQVDAVKELIDSQKYPDFYTIDIICHGVPSVRMFQDYISEQEKKTGRTVTDMKFRDKVKGWGLKGSITYRFPDGSVKRKLVPVNTSSYYRLFLTSEIYRENCYQCKYASQKRTGDITIGDYWGIENEHPEYLQNEQLNPEEGISCILVNTARGKKLLSQYGTDLTLLPSSFEKASRKNEQLTRPSHKGKNRETILKIYEQPGYHGIEQWYLKKQGAKVILYWFWNRIPPKLQKKLKKNS